MTRLFGREQEQRRLLDLLGRARSEGGVGVVLVGDPGIGKSSMLDWLSSHAAGFTVLRARGHDADSGTSYLVLRQVLRSVRQHLGTIDQPLAEALAAAISLSGETTTEALVPLAVLELFSEATSDSPLLILLDDAQDFDHVSLAAFTFCARRLLAENVLIVFAVRPLEVAEWAVFESLETIRLVGLDELAGRKFVEASGHSFTTELFSATRGNPLALLQMSTDAGPEGQMQLADRLVAGFGRGIRRLPAPTQRALALVAVAGSIEVGVLDEALELMGVDRTDLAMARSQGILAAGNDFNHPLMREVARPQAPVLLEYHDALAAAWRDVSPERHLLHRLLGSGPHTAEMRHAAVEHASLQSASGRVDDAEALLLAAAACEPDGRERALLLRSAALGAYYSLRFEHSVRLFRRALEATDDSEVRCSVLRTMVWPELFCGANARDLAAALRAAVDAVPADTADRTGLIRAWGSLIALYSAFDCFEAVAAYRQAPADDFLVADSAEALSLAGDADALALRRAIESARAEPRPFERLEEDNSSAVHGDLLLLEGRWAEADEWSHRHFETAKRLGVETDVAVTGARWMLSRAFLGDGTTAYGLALGALERAPGLVSVLAASSYVGAIVGAENAQEWAQRLLHTAQRAERNGYAIQGHSRLGLLCLAADDPVAAEPHLAAAWALMIRHGYRHPGFAFGRGDIGEAFARVGRDDDARVVAAELAGGLLASDWTRGVAARVLGILGDPGQFALSLQLVQASAWEVARTQLCWARSIRESDPASSRQRALSALATFQNTGARPWAAQARLLLRLAHSDSVRQLPDIVDRLETLSERERSVALAVARGLSNKAAAAELFISQKTVDSHLQQIYRKLGVRSRTQLAVVCYGEQSSATP